MASDQEIAKGVETVLRQSDPNAVNTVHGVVQQLEAKLGLDLSHKASFIRDQINLLLRAHSQPPQPPKEHFALQHHPHYAQFPPHFALQQLQQQQQQLHHQHQHQQHHHNLYRQAEDLNFGHHLQPTQQHQAHVQSHHQPEAPQLPPEPPVAAKRKAKNTGSNSSGAPNDGAPAKRRGGPGGLNKLCGVSPELQAIVGEPNLSRTEIVKQLWVYIRKNNLQDPSNKRKIICDDALRLVFETDCTDMFKMNKLLSKHIIRLEPPKEPQTKRLKLDAESAPESSEKAEPSPHPVIISEALANFLGTAEREMLQTEVSRRVWEYIKINQLEDPLNPVAILCDFKLQELLGCESISVVGMTEMLARRHLFKQ